MITEDLLTCEHKLKIYNLVRDKDEDDESLYGEFSRMSASMS